MPLETEEAIMRRALKGATYREIARESDVSLATVNRVVEDARKKMPDIDELRTLSITLRKHKLCIFDAARGSKLLESLNNYGINIQELENYVRLTERFLSEQALKEDFITCATRLIQLEQACGKTYDEVVEDFEKRHREATELEIRKADIEKRIHALNIDNERSEKHLAEVKSEIQKAVTIREGLVEIGVNNLAKLVKFVGEFESLGFDARELQKLARTLQGLRKINVDPDQLHRFIVEKGPLEAQNTTLRLVNERLKDESMNLIHRNRNLLEQNSALEVLDEAWKTRAFTIFCRSCRNPMAIEFRSREYYQELIDTGQPLSVWCRICGPTLSTAWDIVFQIGWSLLPAVENELNH